MDEIKKEPEKKEANKTPIEKVTNKKGRKAKTPEEKEADRKKNVKIKSFCLLVGIEEKEYPNSTTRRIEILESAKKTFEHKIHKINTELEKEYINDLDKYDVNKLKKIKLIIEEKLEKELGK